MILMVKVSKETALEAFDEGNVLFWFIDSQKPTITTSDLEILKEFEGKKVIIFNKADKCAPSELRTNCGRRSKYALS